MQPTPPVVGGEAQMVSMCEGDVSVSRLKMAFMN